MELLTAISLAAVSFLSAFIGVKLGLHGVKWQIRYDEQTKQYTVSQEPMKPGKVYFMPDATQEELDEMQKEPKWRKFLKGFKRV